MRFIDAISYRFYFTCLQDGKVDDVLTNALLCFLEETKEYVDQYLDGLKANGTLNFFFDNGFIFLQKVPHINVPVWDKIAFRIANDENWSHCGIKQIGRGIKEEYYCTATKEQKRYNRLSSLLIRRGFGQETQADDEIADLLASLLDCPSPSLEGIAFSSDSFAGLNPFHIEYIRVSNRDEKHKYLWIPAVSNIMDDQKYCCHTMIVELPRFLFKDGFPFQSIWTNRLKQLCSRYEWSFGNVSMDVFCSSRMFSGLEESSGVHYFSKYLPGYAWGMCCDGEQVKLMGGSTAIRQAGVFYEVIDLPNTGAFLQMSEDINNLPKTTNDQAAVFLSAFLPKTALYCDKLIPVSCRLMAGREDIHLYSDDELFKNRGIARYAINLFH